MSKTPTPRTDAEYWRQYPNGSDGWGFARTLEHDHSDLLVALESVKDTLMSIDAGVHPKIEMATETAIAALAKARGAA